MAPDPAPVAPGSVPPARGRFTGALFCPAGAPASWFAGFGDRGVTVAGALPEFTVALPPCWSLVERGRVGEAVPPLVGEPGWGVGRALKSGILPRSPNVTPCCSSIFLYFSRIRSAS